MPTPHFLETLLDRPIAFHRVFFDLTQSVKAALLLSQALYWSRRTKDETGWFYKSREEWFAETGLFRYEQESARGILRQLDVWEEKREGTPARLFYRVNFDNLYLKLVQLHEEARRETTNKMAENQPTRRRKTSHLSYYRDYSRDY